MNMQTLTQEQRNSITDSFLLVEHRARHLAEQTIRIDECLANYSVDSIALCPSSMTVTINLARKFYNSKKLEYKIDSLLDNDVFTEIDLKLEQSIKRKNAVQATHKKHSDLHKSLDSQVKVIADKIKNELEQDKVLVRQQKDIERLVSLLDKYAPGTEVKLKVEVSKAQETITKDDYFDIRRCWAEVCSSDLRKSWIHAKWKCKQRGAFHLKHYIMYAILCGKDTEKCVCNVESECYKDAIAEIKRAFTSNGNAVLAANLLWPFGSKISFAKAQTAVNNWIMSTK